jgi:hypothetical protein
LFGKRIRGDIMSTFCTLFDSKYIDKGITLYESLLKVTDSFELYVFAFDQKAYDILIDMDLVNMTVISLKEFETDRMLSVKKERSPAEYCWTCTPITIEYVLERFNKKQCTYLDADLYFFSDPDILLEEISDTGDSVIITEHRFPPDKMEEGIKESGRYCVQFNTFNKDENGMKILKTWKDQCLDWCYYTKEGDKKGDQKYLEKWTYLYKGVHELKNLGGGVAPWNVSQYNYITDYDGIVLSYKGEKFNLIFYHFQNIRYLPFSFVNIKLGIRNSFIKRKIYMPYLAHIERVRKNLYEKYGLQFTIKKGYFTNPILRFIQDYIMPFRIKCFSDIINLRYLR